MPRWLIDAFGDVVQTRLDLARLSDSIGLEGEQLITYLVRNMGYADVERRGGCLWVSFAPDYLGDLTAISLLYKLGDHIQIPCTLAIVSGRKIETLHVSSGEAAIRRLTQILRERLATTSGRFFRRRIQLRTLPATSPFVDLMREAADGRSTFDKLKPSLFREFDQRYLLLEQKTEGLYLADAGVGYLTLGNDWRHQSIGQPWGRFEDPEYQRFVVDAYKEAIAFPGATLEEVDVTVRPAGRRPTILSYQRMILPITVDRRKTCFLSVTLMNCSPIASR
ncbi:MAG: hypothetical protein ACKVP7_24720 [Hyphomicrobiaceae bacterium]